MSDPDRFEKFRKEMVGDKKQRVFKGNKSFLSYQNVQKRIKSQQKNGFKGHKDRYKKDAGYKKQCDENPNGPVPKRLMIEMRGDGKEESYWTYAESNSSEDEELESPQ